MLDKKGRQTGLRAHLTAAEMEEGHTRFPAEKMKKIAIFCAWSQDTWMLQKIADMLALSLPSDASK